MDMENSMLKIIRNLSYVFVPYDEPIVGYHTTTTNTLRLWDAEVDEDSVNSGGLNEYLNQVTAITTNVYPDDSTIEGKRLRLTQEYFFVCLWN